MLEVEITEQGEQLKEQAVSIPSKVSGCVKLDREEAIQLYHLLHKVLDGIKDE